MKITKIDSVESSNKEKPKLRVAAYARVSTSSDAQLESLDTQRSHYEHYIRSRSDWELAGIYIDEGISGTKAEKRPELQRLMLDCKSRKIDLVITKSISRFSRNTTDCLEMIRMLLSIGVPVFFEKENINTGTMESELFLSILSSMAEDESNSISTNSKWSIKNRFKNGTYKISYPPFGYDWNGKQMILIPEQAKIVKHIFDSFLSGKSSSIIAKELNSEGLKGKRGGKWTASSVRMILTNEKYTGDVIFQKSYTDDNFNRRKNNGELDQYLITDHHEAIITHEQFDLVQSLIVQHASEKNISYGTSKYQNRYEFSSKIICGNCGTTFKRRTHYTNSGNYIAWCCSTHVNEKEKCNMQYIRDDDIKAAFVTMLNKLIYSLDLILKPYLKELKENSGDAGLRKIEEIEQRILQNTEKRETLTKLMAQGYLDQILYTQETNSLQLEVTNYRSEIDAITLSLTGNSTRVIETEKLISFLSKSNMFYTFEPALFTEFIDHIEAIKRDEIKFILKNGLKLTERIGD